MNKVKYTLISLLAVGFVLTGAVTAFAQNSTATQEQSQSAIASAGIGPSSPFYFADRLFESLGNAFTFTKKTRAKRYLQQAEERLAEADESSSDADALEKAMGLYQRQQQKVFRNASSSQNTDIISEVASSTTQHLSVLDAVSERVPDAAKSSIQKAKENSMKGQLSALDALSKNNPTQAARISADAAQNRLEAARSRAESGGDDEKETDDVTAAVDEYKQYADFGEKISEMAQGMQSGTSTVEDIVQQARQRHLQILQEVHDKVPPQARAGIQRAMQNSQRGQESPSSAASSSKARSGSGASTASEAKPESAGTQQPPTSTTERPQSPMSDDNPTTSREIEGQQEQPDENNRPDGMPGGN